MHIMPGTRRVIALGLLCAAVPLAAVSVLAGGIGLLWTISTGDSAGVLGVLLTYGVPVLCTAAGVWTFNNGRYIWAAALTLPLLSLSLFFVATARF